MRNLLGNLAVQNKLWLQIGLGVVGMALIAFIALSSLNDNLLEDRKLKTRHLVETAHGLLAHYETLAANGAMTNKAAQEAAIAAIKSLRYAENDYFWVNDMHPTMIMHPFKPQLDGKDLAGVKDLNGKRLFVEFVNTVRQQGEGFVSYLWPKPGAEEPVKKISYVKGFQPWGWVIGSGIYIDDVARIFWDYALWLIAIVVIMALLTIAVSFLISASIILPIRDLQGAMSGVTEHGDFNSRAKTNTSDELGQLAVNFNSMLERIQDFLETIFRVAERLSESANQMTAVSSQNQHNALQQKMDTEQVATAMSQMSASIQEVSRNAHKAAAAATHADKISSEGTSIVKSATQSIDSLASEVENASQVIHRLENDAASIGRVLDVIRGIAEQTNLLALNAAIEAARAGEQGRGFAVVADEVRTLAQRTQESTAEIQTMIETVQAATHEAVQAMEQGRSQTLASVAQTEEIGTALGSIVAAVTEINELNVQIASATEQQSAVSEEINSNIANISQLAGQTSEGAQSTTEASEGSLCLAKELQDLAKQLAG